jgi:hypothetical protein
MRGDEWYVRNTITPSPNKGLVVRSDARHDPQVCDGLRGRPETPHPFVRLFFSDRAAPSLNVMTRRSARARRIR